MKRRVVYIELQSSLEVGQSATVIPVNHPDTENVTNGYPCYTSPVVSIYPDGKTFDTYNTHYTPLPELAGDDAMLGDAHEDVHGQPPVKASRIYKWRDAA